MSALVLYFVILCVAINLNGATQVNIEAIMHIKDAYQTFDEYEMWGFDFVNKSALTVKVNVVIEKEKYTSLLSMKDKITITNMIYPDVDIALKKLRQRLNNRTIWKAGADPDEFFDQYRDWAEYTEFINDFVSRNPTIASFEDFQNGGLGLTLQGSVIPLIKLTAPTGDNKATIYIQAEVHAR